MKKLYLTRQAPNPRKVVLLMQAKGIDIDDVNDLEVVDIDFAKGEQLTSEFSQLNPMKTVPVLTLEDGTVLNDSQAICEYLDAIYGDSSLMGGADTVKRARISAMSRIAEFEVLYNFMLAFQHSHPSKAFRVDQVAEFAPKSIDRAINALPYFDNILKDNNYLVANQFSFADIVLYVGLDFGRVLKFKAADHGIGIANFYKRMNDKFKLTQ